MNQVVIFLSGFIFALGLGISGMTQPGVVKGFLDILGDWNPNLLGVMIGAICVHAVAYRVIIKRRSPVFAATFQIPSRKDIDMKLILGAAIFGIGWGWSGICPGPGIVALISGQKSIFIFIAAMSAGMIFFQFIERRYLR